MPYKLLWILIAIGIVLLLFRVLGVLFRIAVVVLVVILIARWLWGSKETS